MARTTLTIRLLVNELIYDVRLQAHNTANMRATTDEQRANIQSVGDDENVDAVYRSIGNAYGTIRDQLADYIVGNETKSSDYQLDGTEDLLLLLSVPSNYNTATTSSIAQYCHGYIVEHALADWFKDTDATDEASHRQQAENIMQQLKDALTRRVRPTRSESQDGILPFTGIKVAVDTAYTASGSGS